MEGKTRFHQKRKEKIYSIFTKSTKNSDIFTLLIQKAVLKKPIVRVKENGQSKLTQTESMVADALTAHLAQKK